MGFENKRKSWFRRGKEKGSVVEGQHDPGKIGKILKVTRRMSKSTITTLHSLSLQ